MRPPLYRLSYIATSRPQSREWYQIRRRYDPVMPFLEEDEETPVDVCGRCGRLCEAAELDKCPVCAKTFCTYCVYRIGSRNYCSRPCGDSFFFGGDVDDEGLSEE